MSNIRVDCQFPGGNIVVDRIERDQIYVHEDTRDTEGDWFYWYFRLAGAAGRTIVVTFTSRDVIGTRGPAMSADGGQSWKWLGRDRVDGQRFTVDVPSAAPEIRLAFGVPYTKWNLDEYLSARPAIARDSLCVSRGGREVGMLRRRTPEPASADPAVPRVVLTARHHCCEAMASYVLEGAIDALLANGVDFVAVPFVDADGVELGDQGKNRRPHDHNRDYEVGRYSEVRAIRELVRTYADARPVVALDLHCPHIRGERNESPYFVGVDDPDVWSEVGRLARRLEAVNDTPIAYSTADNLPFGTAWNVAPPPGQLSFSAWASRQPGVCLASTLEFPYANVGDTTVTPDMARMFGKSVAAALTWYVHGYRFTPQE